MGVAAALVATACSVSSAVTTNLFDDFNGSSLDLTKWSTTTNLGLSVSSSELILNSGSVGVSFINVTSLQSFQPVINTTHEQYEARFAVTNIADTWAGFWDGSSGPALVFRNDQNGNWWAQNSALGQFFDTRITAPFNTAQTLDILWTFNSVTFRIDSNNDGIYDYSTNLAFNASTAIPLILRDQRSGSLTAFDYALVTSVPEPGSLALAGIGLVAVAWRRVRR